MAPGGFLGGPPAGGGDTATLSQAIAYANAHGGGTIAVASQTGAASAIIGSGADVVGIGGFSGRESEVSTDWLADAVASGRVRRVVTDGSYGMGPPHRGIGASRLMAAVQQTCAPVSSVSGLYDCAGKAGALRAAG
jgi:hypothetical protein